MRLSIRCHYPYCHPLQWHTQEGPRSSLWCCSLITWYCNCWQCYDFPLPSVQVCAHTKDSNLPSKFKPSGIPPAPCGVLYKFEVDNKSKWPPLMETKTGVQGVDLPWASKPIMWTLQCYFWCTRQIHGQCWWIPRSMRMYGKEMGARGGHGTGMLDVRRWGRVLREHPNMDGQCMATLMVMYCEQLSP